MISPASGHPGPTFHQSLCAHAGIGPVSEALREEFLPSIAPVSYSTVPMLFEFLGSLREHKDSIDWASKLDHFSPGAVAHLIEKYHAGNSAMLTALVDETIPTPPSTSGLFFETRPFSSLLTLPLVHSSSQRAQGVEWPEARKSLHDKTGVFWAYSEGGEDSPVVVLRLQFQESDPIEQYPSRKAFEAEYKRFNTGFLEPVTDSWSYLRALIRTTLVHVIHRKDTNETLKLHLLDGTLEVENRVTPTLPISASPIIPLCLTHMLEHPQGPVDILFNGAVYHLLGNEAFELVVDAYAAHFGLPADFKENLRFLVLNRERFFREIVPSPGPILLDVWPHYKLAESQQASANKALSRTQTSLDSDLPKKKIEADTAFDKAVQTLMQGKSDEAIQALQQAQVNYRDIAQICQGKQGVPIEVILNDNPLEGSF